jgi:hypothetical protein
MPTRKRGKKVIRSKYEIGKAIRLWDPVSESPVEGTLKLVRKEDGFQILVIENSDSNEISIRLPMSLGQDRPKKEKSDKKKSKFIKLIIGKSIIGVSRHVGEDLLSGNVAAEPVLEGQLVGIHKKSDDQSSPVLLLLKPVSTVETSNTADTRTAVN